MDDRASRYERDPTLQHPFDAGSQAPASVLVVGDTHANVSWIRRTVTQVVRHGDHQANRPIDVVLIAGDAGLDPLFGGFLDELESLAWSGADRRDGRPTWVLCLDGNHDHLPWLASLPRDEHGCAWLRPHVAHLARGARWTWAGERWGALGGAVSVDGGWRDDDFFPELEAIQPHEAARLVAGGELDVLIAHDAPLGVPIRGGFRLDQVTDGAVTECRRALTEAIIATRARLVLHGHLHATGDRELHLRDNVVTRVVSLRCDDSKRTEACRIVRIGKGPAPMDATATPHN